MFMCFFFKKKNHPAVTCHLLTHSRKKKTGLNRICCSGLTRSLNVTYFRPSPKGATVVITSTVVRAGKNLATIRGVITDKADGKICSTADHLKYSGGVTDSKL